MGHFQVPVREMRVLSQFDVAGLVEDLGLGPKCAGGLEIVNDRQTIRLVGDFPALRRLVYVFGLLTNVLERTLPAESLAFVGRAADEAQAQFIADFVGNSLGGPQGAPGAPGDAGTMRASVGSVGSSGGIGAQTQNYTNSTASAPRAGRGSLSGPGNGLEDEKEAQEHRDSRESAEVAVGGYPGSILDPKITRQSSTDFGYVAGPSARERWEARGVESGSDPEADGDGEADADAGLTQTRRIPRKSPLEAATTVTTTVRTHGRRHESERENEGILRGPRSPRSPRAHHEQRSGESTLRTTDFRQESVPTAGF